MRLGFDIDGIVSNTTGIFIKHLKEQYDIEWSEDKFTDYEFKTCNFTGNLNLNMRIRYDLYAIGSDIDFLKNAEPYEDAIKCIRRFKKQGHKIHFITSRNKNLSDMTVKWFRYNNIPFNSIHNVGKNEKGITGRLLNLDFYIDDYEKHLESMWSYKKRWRCGLSLLTHPWNKNSIDGSRFVRLNNWTEVERHLGISNR